MSKADLFPLTLRFVDLFPLTTGICLLVSVNGQVNFGIDTGVPRHVGTVVLMTKE